jgi:hypothetical protein
VIKIAVLVFELERLVVVRLCVHHFPNAGDRRVFANKSICIASVYSTTVRFLIKVDYGELCKAVLLAESFGIHDFTNHGTQATQTKQ